MDLLAHIAFGFWLNVKYDIPWGVLLATIFDIDHVIGYFYDRRKQPYIKFPKVYRFVYRPRSWFHSISGLLLISTISVFVFHLNWRIVLIALSSHLFLDVIDVHGIYVFPPFTKMKISGSLPLSYVWENPALHRHNRKAHIPSIAFIIFFSLLTILRIY